MKQHFRAPWDTRLKVTTAIFSAFFLFLFFRANNTMATTALLFILIFCLAFAVRGYSIMNGRLLVHRLGWANKFDLANLNSVEFNPGAMLGSIRMLGIGGFFGFVGRFRNEVLGSYRAYATNALHAVVLDFGKERIVVTPESPSEFIEAVKAHAKPKTLEMKS